MGSPAFPVSGAAPEHTRDQPPLEASIDEARGGGSPRPRQGRRRVLAAVAAIIALSAVAAVIVTKPGSDTPVAVKREGAAPAFDLPRLGAPGERVSLADFAGRPVVVNFWASWCVPCRKEMPAFQAVYERIGAKVAFVGVNHQDGRSAAEEFQAATGVRYPSGYDPQGKVAAAYGLFGLPTTVLIDDGRIVARKVGEVTQRELEDLIRRAFGVEVGTMSPERSRMTG